MNESSEPTDDVLDAPEPEEAPVEGLDQVLVSVDAPWNLDRFIVEAPSGATLIIDRGGVLVDHTDVEAVVETANANGVSLRIGK